MTKGGHWTPHLPTSRSGTHTPDTPGKPILVLGAGVIGLTTALKIQLQGGYRVLILADTLPSDPKSIAYTSQWAGAHHVYSAREENGLQYKLEQATFDTMWKKSEPGSEAEECFLRVPQTEYFFDEASEIKPLRSMPNFKYLEQDSLIPGAKLGVSFTTLTIDTPIYLNYLLSRFLANGGKILRGSVQHINQVIEAGARIFAGGTTVGHSADPPVAVINCTGLGARFLGGVEDKSVYPVRGQTVLVRAPWVRFGRTTYRDDTGAWTYIIPRRSSDVIVGGTRARDDWFPKPRPETTEDILRRGLELCPELAPPEARLGGRKPTLEDVMPHVVGEGCGLRPAREGGVRIETEWTEDIGGRGRVPIIHNYGHGGAGFQASWGSSVVVLELLEEALSQLEKS
ncbi:D-amino-acid oxidase [Coprinopsis cinerea okayama7|uniref:D-amino-acid oxidase n=1 Tax=Coprinopsis cinerea (strain Okayama-7 / 130 / ATCC MYA-4618 / FGSC 9003) TaxID=240176 RepID=D6RQI6_COPC7|nr:D-amino-acid oxidase [Coprinopsis cinerea okayama7\|eukprot:XP_002910296.1 D-amino-acid oxidase [Coprinopsis cinerea okayama7\